MKTFFLPKKSEDGVIDIVEVVLYSDIEAINEIKLDKETIIKVGYDQDDIFEGVIPKTILASFTVFAGI